jgi:hypothetical protein
MGHIFYNLFMACCMFILSMSGLVFALATWRRSTQQVCAKCKKKLYK